MTQLVDITAETDDAFFRCLGPVGSENNQRQMRRKWYEDHCALGYRAKVLVLDSGEVVGKCHYAPIDQSPLLGQDPLVILCLYVHMYEGHDGDRRGHGYGRFMLEAVERDARDSGYKGVATWAMDWDWNPVSFYDHMGYARVDREDKVQVVWNPFVEGAEPPQLLRLPNVSREIGVSWVHILVADNAWCNGLEKLRVVREATEGLDELVEVQVAASPCHGRIIHLGHVGGVLLDGQVYRPYQLIGPAEDLRAEILRRHRLKVGTRP